MTDENFSRFLQTQAFQNQFWKQALVILKIKPNKILISEFHVWSYISIYINSFPLCMAQEEPSSYDLVSFFLSSLEKPRSSFFHNYWTTTSSYGPFTSSISFYVILVVSSEFSFPTYFLWFYQTAPQPIMTYIDNVVTQIWHA